MTLRIRARLRLGLALALSWIAPLAPAPAAEGEAPPFLLERITVAGPFAAPARIVIAESRLEEGKAYTEDELRLAVYRIQRLPFIVDADFALERGSERGAYELVITARPARRFFYEHSLEVTSFNQRLNLDTTGMSNEVRTPGLVGIRQFVGTTGVLFAALDSQEGVQLGFVRYDLLGRGAVASVAYSHTQCCSQEVLPFGIDPNLALWVWGQSGRVSIDLAVPLVGNHSLRFSASDRRGDASERRGVFDSFQADNGFLLEGDGTLVYDRTALRWVFDSSDDPVVPTRGTTVSAGVESAWFRAHDLERREPTGAGTSITPLPPFEGREVAAVAEATHHFPVTLRQTLSVTGRVSAGKSRVDNLSTFSGVPQRSRFDAYSASAGARHSFRIWRQRSRQDFGDLRLETGAEVGREWVSPSFDLPDNPLNRFQVSVGMLYRNAWGRLRFALSYLFLGGEQRR